MNPHNTQNQPKTDDSVTNPHKYDDLDEIPYFLRATIQKIIDQKVAHRINEEMAQLKDEIRAQLAD